MAINSFNANAGWNALLEANRFGIGLQQKGFRDMLQGVEEAAEGYFENRLYNRISDTAMNGTPEENNALKAELMRNPQALRAYENYINQVEQGEREQYFQGALGSNDEKERENALLMHPFSKENLMYQKQYGLLNQRNDTARREAFRPRVLEVLATESLEDDLLLAQEFAEKPWMLEEYNKLRDLQPENAIYSRAEETANDKALADINKTNADIRKINSDIGFTDVKEDYYEANIRSIDLDSFKKRVQIVEDTYTNNPGGRLDETAKLDVKNKFNEFLENPSYAKQMKITAGFNSRAKSEYFSDLVGDITQYKVGEGTAKQRDYEETMKRLSVMPEGLSLKERKDFINNAANAMNNSKGSQEAVADFRKLRDYVTPYKQSALKSLGGNKSTESVNALLNEFFPNAARELKEVLATNDPVAIKAFAAKHSGNKAVMEALDASLDTIQNVNKALPIADPGWSDETKNRVNAAFSSGKTEDIVNLTADYAEDNSVLGAISTHLDNLEKLNKIDAAKAGDLRKKIEWEEKENNKRDLAIKQMRRVARVYIAIEQLKANEEGLKQSVGFKNPITTSWSKDAPIDAEGVPIPRSGTPGANFYTLLEEVKANNFMSGINEAKANGLVGSLSNAEGSKIDSAIKSLSRRVSEPMMVKQLNKLQNILLNSITKDKEWFEKKRIRDFSSFRDVMLDEIQGLEQADPELFELFEKANPDINRTPPPQEDMSYQQRALSGNKINLLQKREALLKELETTHE